MSAFIASLVACSTQTNIASQRPNILLVLTDDQGWGDLGLNGNQKIDTPTIDKLAHDGVSFDRFYVSPVCSPTRASLLTGRHSLATGVHSVTRGGEKMLPDEQTIAEYLQNAGYKTGLFGKWHNGLQYPHNPLGQGFDEFYGFADGHITDYFDGHLQHNRSTEAFAGYLPDRLTDHAIEFMRDNQQPFFAYLSFNTPHSPFELPQQYFDKYKKRGLTNVEASVYGMVENIDQNLQRVFRQLERNGSLNNTIVVFLSDNGPAFPGGQARYNGEMKGWKGKLDEGGVRVPFIISWPDHISGGRRITPIAQHLDVLPTLLALTGIDRAPVKPIHGDDLTPLILDANQAQAVNWPDRTLFTHHFRNTTRPDEVAISESPGAVRTQRWLATSDHNNHWSLYDLEADPKQTQNVASEHPTRLAELKQEYAQWYRKTRLPDYAPLPVHVGHAGYPEVMFPAHEAAIVKEGVNYRHGDGWAHDWLISTGQTAGQIQWPIDVINGGSYELVIGYETPDGSYDGEITAQAQGARYTFDSLPPYQSTVRQGQRRAETGEAPTQSWAEQSQKIKLHAGPGELTLSFGRDAQNRNLAVKYLRLVKRND